MTTVRKKFRRISREEETAYHEAGHAVVALRLNRPLTCATIVPSGDGETLGHISGRKLSPQMREQYIGGPGCGRAGRRLRDVIEAEIVVLFAGGLAEARWKGHRRRLGTGEDYRQAVEWADCICGSMEETAAFLGWLHVRARQLVDNPVDWFLIRRFASVLVEEKTVNGRRAREVFRQALTESHRLDFTAEWEALDSKRTPGKKTTKKRKGK
jgi:hypothetical protein